MFFILVVGGGKVGSNLASLLIEEGQEVKVIDDRPEVIARLKQELPEGSVTADDEANLVITSLARFEFNVPRVIARVNDPRNAWMFNSEMGVDVALNQADLMAKLIAEEMSLGDMMTLLKLRRGEYALVEEKLRPVSKALGIPLKDMNLPMTCVIAAVIRKGSLLIPR